MTTFQELPLSAIRHLKAQTLSWVRFHGSQKRKLLSLGGYDIVITTFETVVGQQKKHNDAKCLEDTLFSFAWHRIVLDEGKRLIPKPCDTATDNRKLTLFGIDQPPWRKLVAQSVPVVDGL